MMDEKVLNIVCMNFVPKDVFFQFDTRSTRLANLKTNRRDEPPLQ